MLQSKHICMSAENVVSCMWVMSPLADNKAKSMNITGLPHTRVRCEKQDEHNAASGATNKQLGITSESQSDATPSVVIIKVDVFCPNH